MRAKTVRNATGWHTSQRDDKRTDRQDESNHSRIEPERTREIERPDHQRRHHHRRDERAHGETRTQHRITEHRQRDQRRCCSRLGEHEEADSEGSSQQQSHVERTETAAPNRHGERISGERQSKQQRAHIVEAGPIRFLPAAIDGQIAMSEKISQDPQR